VFVSVILYPTISVSPMELNRVECCHRTCSLNTSGVCCV